MIRKELLELTPDKTRVVKNKDYIKIVHINKIGKIKKREQCKECKHIARVQLGLGWGIGTCCDQPENGWKEFNGITERKCKLFEFKQPVK